MILLVGYPANLLAGYDVPEAKAVAVRRDECLAIRGKEHQRCTNGQRAELIACGNVPNLGFIRRSVAVLSHKKLKIGGKV